MKIKIEYEIPDNSVELLTRLKEKGYAEFRDHHYDNVQEYLADKLPEVFSDEQQIELTEKFYRRNFCDLEDMIALSAVDFVEDDDMAWHYTFKISRKGLKFLEENSK